MRTVDFVPLEMLHVKHLVGGAARHVFKGLLDDATISAMCAGPLASAALVDGAAVACAGLMDEKQGRARAWAIVGPAMPLSAWPPAISRMRDGIAAALDPVTGFAHRVWAETAYDWPDGHKLLLHLGMQYEGLSRGAFGPGQHGVVYARVRDDVAALPVRVRVLNNTAERCLWEDSMADAVPWAVEQARRGTRRAA